MSFSLQDPFVDENNVGGIKAVAVKGRPPLQNRQQNRQQQNIIVKLSVSNNSTNLNCELRKNF